MRSYTSAGVVGILASLVCFGTAGLIIVSALDNKGVSEKAYSVIETSCREQVLKLGGRPVYTDKVLKVDFPDVSDPVRALGDATALLAICPNRQIIDVCLGVGCSSQGTALSSVVHLVVKMAEVKK